MDLDQALEKALEHDAPRLLTPELAQEFPDLVADMKSHPSLQAKWAAHIVKKAQVQAVLAADERLAIARANAELGPRQAVKGLGQQVAAIGPRDMAYMCWKDGHNWFRDHDLLRWTVNRHPEMKVAFQAKRNTIHVDGLRDRERQTVELGNGLKASEDRFTSFEDDDFPAAGCGAAGEPPSTRVFEVHEAPDPEFTPEGKLRVERTASPLVESPEGSKTLNSQLSTLN